MIEYILGVIAGVGLVAIGLVVAAICTAVKQNKQKSPKPKKCDKDFYIIYYEPNK